jgi:hypothetical protein
MAYPYGSITCIRLSGYNLSTFVYQGHPFVFINKCCKCMLSLSNSKEKEFYLVKIYYK